MRQHFYEDVPRLGHVAVSRHAQERLDEESVSVEAFEDALMKGKDVPDGSDVVWREKNGLRLVILLRPEPFRGARLVKTAFWIRPQERVR